VKTFDWVTFMRRHPILSGLNDQHVQWLLGDEASTERHHDAGEIIVREGEHGDSIFLIGAGTAEAVLTAADGQRIVLSVMSAGETFGEMGLFERRSRSATVRARDTCVVLEIRGAALYHLVDAHPKLEFKVLLNVSERLRSKNEQLLALHLKSADSANRAKDEFLAMLGHELRNPLGAISTAIHVLDRLGKPGDQTAPLRDIIGRQTRQLARLLDDLLDVSKLVSGKIRLHRRQDDLKTIAMRVVSSFDEVGKTTRHTVNVAGDAVAVYADPLRLEQVVGNLLDNALKYTPSGGRIDVIVAAEPDHARLTVRDTGIGIAADMLPRIFDLFVQANPTFDRADGGLGLGLTLVKRLVELHGGSVSASSAGPHRGTEFVVRIPRWSADADAGPGGATATDPFARRHVLLVEHNRDLRHGLRVLLESWQYRVEEAASAARGLEILRASRPPIALVDLDVPDLDAHAIVSAGRSVAGGAAVVLIALTEGQQGGRLSDTAGFDAHLPKPVNPKTLARTLAFVSA
jgi:signal transduction histidine kinase/CheY-like chemotaxis protein